MRKGFTLIELLVVIAIIAILAAILFPVFARARAKAQQANCLSNVKQLALGILMYASDNDNCLPPGHSQFIMAGWDTALNWHAWDECIYPYVKNAQIYLCPSDPTAAGAWSGTAWTAGGSCNYNGFPSSYAYNCNIQGRNASGASQFGEGRMPQDYYAYPAERMLISDAAVGSGVIYWAGSETYINNTHNGGANMGYVDGHAKWMAKTAVPVFAWPMTDNVSCHFWAGLDLPGQ
ncbi:MAG TPA: prepilin-type N-terminal cleavage/methylation domain-containing protein [Armatimonadota bacterium]|jgi:prepilin-type N-terminal cleavage/methylation domain-containing protein/prepilin-type processing-associated H-X9-DG protein